MPTTEGTLSVSTDNKKEQLHRISTVFLLFCMETVGVEGLEKSSTPIITRFSKNVGTFVGTLLYYLQKNQY